MRLDTCMWQASAFHFFFFWFGKACFCGYFQFSMGLMYCLRDSQTSLFIHFFIKNGSHDTIYTFKNYFVTIFSIFSKIDCIQTDPQYFN